MTNKLFSVDLVICSTAYIKAETAEEAAKILAAMDNCLEFKAGQYVNEGLSISAYGYDDLRLPSFSLSPIMTAYPGAVLTLEQAGKEIDPEAFECVYDPDPEPVCPAGMPEIWEADRTTADGE